MLGLQGPEKIIPINGRSTLLSLNTHFEGKNYSKRNIEDAYVTKELLHYEGECHGFTLEIFVVKHDEAYLELKC